MSICLPKQIQRKLIQKKTEAVKNANELVSIGEKLGLNLKGVDAADDLDEINSYTQKLEGMLKKCETAIAKAEKELQEAQNEMNALKSDEKSQVVRLNTLNQQILEKNRKMETLQKNIETINNENEEAQERYNLQYSAAVTAAEDDYNPDSDGDKQSFINSRTAGINKTNSQNTSSMENEYSKLANEYENLTTSANVISQQTLPNVRNKIQQTQIVVDTKQQTYDTAVEDKQKVETEKSSMPKKGAEVIKNSVSSKEWALIEKYNIDLSATFAGGAPKFMLAKGKSDNKYHIYEFNGPCESKATSLARKYAPGGGYDIVSNGNGRLYDYSLSNKSEKNLYGNKTKDIYGNPIYPWFSSQTASKTVKFTMSSSGAADWNTQSATYTTQSPLAFDLNNNGIETSNSLISYDIDGDGILDNINNVNEGILCFDKDHDGIAGSDGSELFGNNTDLDGDGKADGYKDGFEALKALASKEGLINGSSDMVLDENDLNLLAEKYGLSMKANGYDSQAQSLFSLGITSINLASTSETTLTDNFDGQFNQLMSQQGATFVQDGIEKDYVDVWNAKK